MAKNKYLSSLSFMSGLGAHGRSTLGTDIGIDKFAKIHGTKRMTGINAGTFKDANKVTSRAQKLAQAMKLPNNIVTGLVGNGPASIFNFGSSLLTYLAENSTSPIGNNQAIYHKTHVHVGTPTSKKIRKFKEDPFVLTETKLLSDSASDYQSHTKRRQLHIKAGFNEKVFAVMMENTFATLEDMYMLFDVKKRFEKQLRGIEDGAMEIFGCITKTHFQIKLKNKLDNYTAHVQIHLVKITNNDMQVRHLLAKMTRNSTIETQDPTGRIPVDFQYTDPETTNLQNKFSVNFQADLRTNLSQSSIFNENAQIVKTWSRTLPASSIWEMNLTTHYGRGLSINMLNDMYKRSDVCSAEKQKKAKEDVENGRQVFEFDLNPADFVSKIIKDITTEGNLKGSKKAVKEATEMANKLMNNYMDQGSLIAGKHPVSYCLYVEAVGDRRSSLLRIKDDDTFDGYSPVFLHAEFSHLIEYLSKEDSPDEILTYKKIRQHRNFEDDSTELQEIFYPDREMRFHVPFDDIKFPGKKTSKEKCNYSMDYDNVLLSNPDTPNIIETINKAMKGLGLTGEATADDAQFKFKEGQKEGDDTTAPPMPESEQKGE